MVYDIKYPVDDGRKRLCIIVSFPFDSRKLVARHIEEGNILNVNLNSSLSKWTNSLKRDEAYYASERSPTLHMNILSREFKSTFVVS